MAWDPETAAMFQGGDPTEKPESLADKARERTDLALARAANKRLENIRREVQNGLGAIERAADSGKRTAALAVGNDISDDVRARLRDFGFEVNSYRLNREETNISISW